jgi:hypothetical protein
MCGERGVYLNAHHILPCRSYPDLIYAVSNGITLCAPCHCKTYNKEHEFRFLEKGGELLGSPERTISSQSEAGTLRQVQRLEAESRPDSNASTSAAPEREDIVRSLQECKEV